jgi:hypothetical protein
MRSASQLVSLEGAFRVGSGVQAAVRADVRASPSVQVTDTHRRQAGRVPGPAADHIRALDGILHRLVRLLVVTLIPVVRGLQHLDALRAVLNLNSHESLLSDEGKSRYINNCT